LLLLIAFSNWTYFTSLLYIRASLLGSVCTVTVGTHILVWIAGLLTEIWKKNLTNT